jgi:hypothetical protein
VFEDVKEALIIPVIALGGKVRWKLLGKIYSVHGLWWVCGNYGVNSSDGVLERGWGTVETGDGVLA